MTPLDFLWAYGAHTSESCPTHDFGSHTFALWHNTHVMCMDNAHAHNKAKKIVVLAYGNPTNPKNTPYPRSFIFIIRIAQLS